MSHTSFIPFPPNELGGAIAVNIFAILSTLALVSVALRAAWLLIRQHLLLTAPEKREHIFFFNTHFGRYGACLLLAMALSATSGMIGIFWLAQQGITEGPVCRFQATLMQIANCGAAYFTVAIALHAFSSLVLRMRQSVVHCRSIMIIGWIMAVSVGLIPLMIRLPFGHVYGADGLTCAVRSVYRRTQFFLCLLPILIGSFLSAILYSLIFLGLRGTLKIRGGFKVTLNPEVRWKNCEEDHLLARVARSMLWYPVAYISLLTPYLIVHLLQISGFAVSFEVIVFAYVCWFSLGVVVVFLLHNTFRILSSVLPPPGGKRFLSSRLRHPSMSWNEKFNPYRNSDFLSSRLTETSSKFFMVDPSPLHQDHSLTTTLPSPVFDYNHIITPPPSASLSSYSDMERRDRESASLLAAGIPVHQSWFTAALPKPGQSLGMYGHNSVHNEDYVFFRDHQSTQTIGRHGA